MKLMREWIEPPDVESHPSRGAWIEMRTIDPTATATAVAPLTGCVD